MTLLLCRVYCALVIVWVLAIILFPSWAGRTYARYGTNRWHGSADSGLEPYSDLLRDWPNGHPIWKPPHYVPFRGDALVQSGDPATRAAPQPPIAPQPQPPRQVRWPFQRVVANPNPQLPGALGEVSLPLVELNWFSNTLRLGVGLLVLGLLVRIVHFFSLSKERDPIITVAWFVALGQLIALPLMYVASWSSFEAATLVSLLGLFAGFATGGYFAFRPHLQRQPMSRLGWVTFGLIAALSLIIAFDSAAMYLGIL